MNNLIPANIRVAYHSKSTCTESKFLQYLIIDVHKRNSEQSVRKEYVRYNQVPNTVIMFINSEVDRVQSARLADTVDFCYCRHATVSDLICFKLNKVYCVRERACAHT